MATTDRDRARAAWRHRGAERPPFAREPGAGEESVWDYPRPPVLVPDERLVEVRAGALVVARSRRVLRLLETASPPTFYVPPADVRCELLVLSARTSSCEWKGRATYWSLDGPDGRIEDCAWSYATPDDGYAPLAGHIAFYPSKLACHVAGERVRSQAGGFYGGWITAEIVGPYKGERGTGGW